MSEKRILIVEDSDDEAFLISLFLKKHGTLKSVWRASNGQEAIDYLTGAGDFADRERYPMPDVILLDLKMPGLNGFDVLKWLQGQSQRPVVVVFTASLDDADRVACLELGADHFAVKPIDVSQLEAFVMWLGGSIREGAKPIACIKCTGGYRVREHLMLNLCADLLRHGGFIVGRVLKTSPNRRTTVARSKVVDRLGCLSCHSFGQTFARRLEPVENN